MCGVAQGEVVFTAAGNVDFGAVDRTQLRQGLHDGGAFHQQRIEVRIAGRHGTCVELQFVAQQQAARFQ